jgi:predicted phosphodiesterase
VSDILILGDCHYPFASKRAINRVIDRLSEKPFAHIIQIGDLLDQYCFTRFPKQNIMLPDREIKYGRELAQRMWAKIHSLQPQSTLVQILGNHDVRLIKRCEERLPEAQDLVKATLLELYRFDNVLTIEDPREEYFINHPIHGKIAALHGYKSRLGDHTKFMHCHTVHGHTHKGGVAYIPIMGKLLWELDVGFLGDNNKTPLGYTPQKTSNSTSGWGEIDDLGPRFIPLIL